MLPVILRTDYRPRDMFRALAAGLPGARSVGVALPALYTEYATVCQSPPRSDRNVTARAQLA